MAFTATNDLMLPATVTGSWPRPRWYTANMWGRPLDTAMMDPWFREQFADAHEVVVSDQARVIICFRMAANKMYIDFLGFKIKTPVNHCF